MRKLKWLYFVFRVVEGTLRSLNNLLEKLHHSYFFYLICATDRFISIVLYMPPLGLILLAPALKISFLNKNVGDSILEVSSCHIFATGSFIISTHSFGGFLAKSVLTNSDWFGAVVSSSACYCNAWNYNWYNFGIVELVVCTSTKSRGWQLKAM